MWVLAERFLELPVLVRQGRGFFPECEVQSKQWIIQCSFLYSALTHMRVTAGTYLYVLKDINVGSQGQRRHPLINTQQFNLCYYWQQSVFLWRIVCLCIMVSVTRENDTITERGLVRRNVRWPAGCWTALSGGELYETWCEALKCHFSFQNQFLLLAKRERTDGELNNVPNASRSLQRWAWKCYLSHSI